MSNVDETIDVKQEYLRSEIMDKNYDVEQFVNFFQTYTDGDDMDLDYIHFNRLKEIVTKFKEEIGKGNLVNRRNTITKDETKSRSNTIKNKEIIVIKKSTTYNSTNIDLTQDNEINEMLLCNKIEKSPLTNEHIQVIIGEAQTIKGTFFSSSYTVYEIKVPSINSKVLRRFKDFEWLREELVSQFPVNFVPTLPVKQMFDNMSEEVIEMRRKYFQYFMDHVMSIPLFRSTQQLYHFLTETDEKSFLKIKKDFENEESIHKLKDTKNLEGILYCKFNKDYSKQAKIMKDYINMKEVAVTNLNYLYDTLKQDYLKVSETLSSISEAYKNLKCISEEFMDPKSIQNTYSMMEKLNSDWSILYKKQSKFFENEIKHFFNFYRSELEKFKDYIFIYQDTKDDYLKYYLSLNHKKEKLFKQGINKWEIEPEVLQHIDPEIVSDKEAAFKVMCTVESSVVNNKRRKLGVTAYYLINDFIKLRNYHSQRYMQHFTNLAMDNKSLLADCFGLVKILHTNATEYTLINDDVLSDEERQKRSSSVMRINNDRKYSNEDISLDSTRRRNTDGSFFEKIDSENV